MSRGTLLNNPLCIRHNGILYVGEVVPSSDAAFKQFAEPKFGIRAAVVILQEYWSRDGIDTVAKAIERWSPPNDGNPTAEYVRNVAEACMVDANTPITLQTVLRPMIKAMGKQEDGQWIYSDELLEQAIELAEDA